jgi:hypothetical protein
MKVLYIASNDAKSGPLRIEQDITELQRAISQVSGDPITFIFLPALPFEDIEQQIAIFKPDILHITAHGKPGELFLSNSAEMQVPLSSATLRAVLAAHIPRLVYINACTSREIATDLAGFVPHAIGTSADITNFAARKSAVSFYRYLLRGHSLDVAFQASSATASTLDASVKTEIFSRTGFEQSREFFYSVPKLLAYFIDHDFSPSKQRYDFMIGMAGASEATMQIVFCTDDESFLTNDTDKVQDDDEIIPEVKLCEVVRTNAIKGEVWTEKNNWQDIEGDFRLYALGITSSGRCYSIAGTLCEALTNFYQVYFDVSDASMFPENLKAAIECLGDNDGSLLRPKRNKEETAGESRRQATIESVTKKRKNHGKT